MNPIAQKFQVQYTQAASSIDSDWRDTRFIILDTEMTGLDSRVDRIVSIGAIACVGMDLILDDAFEAFIQITHNTSSVHVHGITRELAELEGSPEPVVLEQFLDYLRGGVIVGHHVYDDLTMLDLAVKRCFGVEKLPNLALDTMHLACVLEPAGLVELSGDETESNVSLDQLCHRFGIAPHDRHTAMGDAFLTGQVFLRLLRRAARAGQRRLEQLVGPPMILDTPT